jgi:hypothetical protein
MICAGWGLSPPEYSAVLNNAAVALKSDDVVDFFDTLTSIGIPGPTVNITPLKP